MLEVKKEVFERMSLEMLMDLLNPDYHIGKTFFDQPSKRWMILHDYNLVAEVNSDEDDVNEWETFGYPIELIGQASGKEVHGANPKETLINFFTSYPGLIVNPMLSHYVAEVTNPKKD
jgi:hypothetical protein